MLPSFTSVTMNGVADLAAQDGSRDGAAKRPSGLADAGGDLGLDLGHHQAHPVHAGGRGGGQARVVRHGVRPGLGHQVDLICGDGRFGGCAVVAVVPGRHLVRGCECGVGPADGLDAEHHPHLTVAGDRAPALEGPADETDVDRRGLSRRQPRGALTSLQDEVVDVVAAVHDRHGQGVAGGDLDPLGGESHPLDGDGHAVVSPVGVTPA